MLTKDVQALGCVELYLLFNFDSLEIPYRKPIAYLINIITYCVKDLLIT
tara:strand:+ start:1127 stop:1273 length:147 start_codon:yes stop_codon:yes gene_type:complete